MSFLDKLNHDAFAHDFLKEYLENGFTSLPKKEIDLLILRLLLVHVDGWSEHEHPSAFTLSQALRAKRGRIRSMLDDLSFRNSGDQDGVRERLRSILDKGEKDFERNRVRLQIEDGYLREYAKSIVQQDFGIVDTSFDRSIISLSGDKFLALVVDVMDENAKEKFKKELQKQLKVREKEPEGLFKTFLKGFAKSAGNEAGKQAINLGVAALTGGLNKIPDLIRSICQSRRNVTEV